MRRRPSPSLRRRPPSPNIREVPRITRPRLLESGARFRSTVVRRHSLNDHYLGSDAIRPAGQLDACPDEGLPSALIRSPHVPARPWFGDVDGWAGGGDGSARPASPQLLVPGRDEGDGKVFECIASRMSVMASRRTGQRCSSRRRAEAAEFAREDREVGGDDRSPTPRFHRHHDGRRRSCYSDAGQLR